MERIFYIKGGRAIEEAHRLFDKVGELPDGGPDKFLLAILFYSQDFNFTLASFGPFSAKSCISGKMVVEYAARSSSNSWLVRRLSLIFSVFNFIKDVFYFRPTKILCGVDGPFSIIALMLARLLSAQYVLLAHNALNLSSMSNIYRKINRLVCRHSDFVIAHGPFVKDEAIYLGARPESTFEFNNALDPAHVELISTLPPKSLNGNPQIILYSGRIEVDKGVIDLLNAFRDLDAKLGAHLRYIGSGGAMELLKDKILKCGLEDRVEVIGAVPFENVFSHLRQATLVVTPSQSSFPEGFCKAAMEALYVGTPVVAPDYGPFPYLIKHGDNGLLYSADNVEAMSAALTSILVDKNLRATLEHGADVSGKNIMRPCVTFSQSIARIFSLKN